DAHARSAGARPGNLPAGFVRAVPAHHCRAAMPWSRGTGDLRDVARLCGRGSPGQPAGYATRAAARLHALAGVRRLRPLSADHADAKEERIVDRYAMRPEKRPSL